MPHHLVLFMVGIGSSLVKFFWFAWRAFKSGNKNHRRETEVFKAAFEQETF
jgi:hypothetical protein